MRRGPENFGISKEEKHMTSLKLPIWKFLREEKKMIFKKNSRIKRRVENENSSKTRVGIASQAGG